MGSPLIKHNMKAHNSCGAWTTYAVDKDPDNSKAYHCSKTICTITDGRLTEEKDIYREKLDDTTILQINVLTHWDWADQQLKIKGDMGKIDQRTLDLRLMDYITRGSRYPNYRFQELNGTQIDSALHSWGLSRFDRD